MFKFFLSIALILLSTPFFSNAQGLKFDTQVFDFGHIGIEFKVYNTYMLVNETDQTVTITDMDVSCDCTTVKPSDTTMHPGDTIYFGLTFDTKDYYGPVNKSFTVFTDYPEKPEIQFFYLAIVGQWFNGLKPDPISIFFLPGKKSKTLKIPNKVFDSINLDYHLRSNEYCNVNVISENADKNEFIELEVSPSPKMPTGTFHSSLTLGIKDSESEEITIMTIPVKMVKY